MYIYKYKKTGGGVIYKALRINSKNNGRIELVWAWATTKGDYWKPEAQEKATFFHIRKNIYDDGTVQRGIYIGRLALVVMKSKTGKEVV